MDNKSEKVFFIVDGVPETKNYRICRNKLFRTSDCKAFEWHIGLCAKIAMAGKVRFKGAIRLKLNIYLYSKKPRDSIYCTSKPDCTNILKSVEDAVKNICFEDDKDVAIQHITKYWCFEENEERVEISIKKLH